MIRTLLAMTMVCAAVYLTMATIGNQPYQNIVPCDTDTDCMEKNPHIEFSLEGDK